MPWTEGEVYTHGDRRLLAKWQASSGGKDRTDRNLDIEKNRIPRRYALRFIPDSQIFDHVSRLRQPVCCVNVAVLQYSNASAVETRLACITDNMAVSHRRHQFSHARTLDKRVWMLKLNSQHRVRSPLPNPLT